MVFRVAIALLISGACAHGASAEPRVTYTAETSYDTNYFSDINRIAVLSLRSSIGVEGEVERDGTKFGYSLNHQEVSVPRYGFAKEHNSWVNVSLSRKISDRLEWSAQMRGTRSDAGDIFLKLPDQVVGYRRLDHKLDLSTTATLDAFGGKNTVTASYTNLMKGTARFRPGYFLPARLEANEALLGLKADHIRALAGGEAGVTLAYNTSLIPDSQQQRYDRFPATNLRGSLAYGRKFGDKLAILVEAGVTTIAGDEVSDKVRRVRPYLRAEAEVALTDRLSLGAGFSQNYALYDLDDPLGEFQRRWKAVMKTKLTKSLGFDLAVERTHKDWIFYDYDSSERRLVATLSLDTGKDRKLELEFSRLLHDEYDEAAAYHGSAISSRFSGSF
ncbi:hypothetical protein G6L37_20015 [Agrobacterium rubi]|uniref:hypothetical protein n=1 Tax=Agrobacterium rubi TaxID=28099 RepID=UPI001572E462|nr:hypothetical protein [Agrobacterium rubi]NTF08458.1 hypothetical protein [Agrobacterium rubi]NTF20686.1 hypothetical protein [Agrobacterium rubi]NTF27656.1 hypothetical protein [Agrobacterium rubi]